MTSQDSDSVLDTSLLIRAYSVQASSMRARSLWLHQALRRGPGGATRFDFEATCEAVADKASRMKRRKTLVDVSARYVALTRGIGVMTAHRNLERLCGGGLITTHAEGSLGSATIWRLHYPRNGQRALIPPFKPIWSSPVLGYHCRATYWTLGYFGTMPTGRLAHTLGVSRNTADRWLRSLQSAGLVDKDGYDWHQTDLHLDIAASRLRAADLYNEHRAMVRADTSTHGARWRGPSSKHAPLGSAPAPWLRHGGSRDGA